MCLDQCASINVLTGPNSAAAGFVDRVAPIGGTCCCSTVVVHIWVVKKNCLDHFGRFVVTHVLFGVVVVCLNATTTTIHVSL